MTMTLRDQIIQQALTLPPEDREYVADLLEGSLPVGEFRTEEIADAWSQEIDRRISAYDRGETTAVDFDVALDNMRQALETHRANKAAQ
ncbi:addiction module protein [Planctomicrobium sp. SH668]|uniref:addiction module protein n=1 Tax=Planctomicrobium sp. SH668 TaxID=3448126 RepID=UPI003F5B9398